ncbi:MAG: capsular polysaccharide biosynthesis protein [Neobacillus sp.]|nr:capsular polysaccharide biosynthesis protein [Neobacillus sp.]
MKNFQPPIGIFNSIKDWIAAKNGNLLNGVDLKEIHPKTPISSTLNRRPPWPPSCFPSEIEGPDGSVGVIPNGRVWGVNGAIITPDNQLIWDVSFEGVDITPDKHSIFKEDALPAVSYYKNVADLTHVYSKNYYHWMYEVIPRIHLLQQSGLPIDHFILNTEDEQPYHLETLHQLGIKKEQLLITHRGFHVQAENLIIPSQPAFPTKWGYDFLRKVFLKETTLDASNNKRIYISRKWSRKIINEDQVMKVLSKYGFVKVGLESLTLAEQVELFSSAEVIIAAHGAGLTNLTFSQSGTKVLEIFPRTYIIPHYWGISSFANLDYYYYIGKADSQTLNKWPGADDIMINIPKFKAYLKKMRLS